MAKKNKPSIGHNSAMNADEKRKLKGFIDSIVSSEQEKAIIQEDIAEFYSSAKDAGFDVKAMRRVVKERLRTHEEKLAERQIVETMETYMHALGMLSDTPLGSAAIRDALKSFGTPVELTEEEKAKGQNAAFIDKEGHRMSIGVHVPKQMDISERNDLPPAAPREYQSTADRPFGIGDDDSLKVAEEA